MSQEQIKIADIIFKFLKGNLTGQESETLEVWLEASEENKRLFEKLKLSSGYRQKKEIYSKFERFYNPESVYKITHKGKRKSLIWITSVAAAVIVIFGISVFFLLDQEDIHVVKETSLIYPGNFMATLITDEGKVRNLESDSLNVEILIEQHKSTSSQEESYFEINVPIGAEYFAVLTDGSKVWLNSESSIKFPLEFKKNERNVWISGEVFFEVTENKDCPFIVNTSTERIKVLGTQFNVQCYENQPFSYTTLVEGSVQINEDAILKPGEQYVYDVEKDNYFVHEVNVELFVSWKDGIYVFRSQRLEDILNSISKWYNLTVYYQDESVKDVTFSGRLKRYENANNLLEAFERFEDVKFEVNDNIIIVKDK